MAGVLLSTARIASNAGGRSLPGIFTPVPIDPVARRPQNSCEPGKLYSRHDGAGALRSVLWANPTRTPDTSAAARGVLVTPGEGSLPLLRRSGQYQARRCQNQSRRVTYPPALIVSKRFGRRRSQEGGRDGRQDPDCHNITCAASVEDHSVFQGTLRTVPAFCSLTANTSFTGL
jgi:hypothetical protein